MAGLLEIGVLAFLRGKRGVGLGLGLSFSSVSLCAVVGGTRREERIMPFQSLPFSFSRLIFVFSWAGIAASVADAFADRAAGAAAWATGPIL